MRTEPRRRAPMPGLPGRPTLTDVARVAGVSRQTASRVARGSGAVSMQTARRVQQAIAELGYRPNGIARALSTGSGRSIGVVTHTAGTYGAISLLAGIEKAAHEVDYGVSVVTLSAFDDDAVESASARLAQGGCDGIIMMAPQEDDGTVLRRLHSRIPTVTTSRVNDARLPSVHPDTEQAAQEAVEHLLDLGHRSIAHLAGPEGWSAATLRASGWRKALVARGLEPRDLLRGDWSARSGYEAGLRIAEDRSITAVFVVNDEMALGMIHALAEHGRRVPEDVSVVGFDDMPGSAYFLPSLTTVSIDSVEHGRLAVELLVGITTQEELPAVPHRLVVRGSTSIPSGPG